MATSLYEQIEKARERARGLNLSRLAEALKDKTPDQIAPEHEKEERQQFLRETLTPDLSRRTFERIIAGNELQPVNYLELGMLAARAICRIELFDPNGAPRGLGSGFLIAPGVLLTNNHVLPSQAMCRRSIAQFDMELDALGDAKPIAEFRLEPDRLFHTLADLDFTVVAVAASGQRGEPLSRYGFLPLIGATGKVVDGEWLTIIQHPGGEPKQVCVRENRLLTRTDDVLWYSTDTLGGSSGSPVFNNTWQVVALHHKGVPEEKNGRIQTVDGQDFDPGRHTEDVIKWVANEGIRISRIVATLKQAKPDHPLLGDVFNMTPARARSVTETMLSSLPLPPARPPESTPMPRSAPAMTRSVTVTLDISDDGRVAVRGTSGAAEAWIERSRTTAPAAGQEDASIDLEVPFDDDYKPTGKRKGYQPGFLAGGYQVLLPDPGPSLDKIATPRSEVKTPKVLADYVLDYFGYSAVMHRTRRLALFTAANVDGGNRFSMKRPPDEWRFDPRIPREAQLGNFYYKNNKFDRGHLTRREDMEFGARPMDALQWAADTCHWVNCAPMHSAFNQNKETWQGLERHVLESAIKASRFAAQVFTGPVLDEGDPTWDRFPDIRYPTRFWKVAVALTSKDKLFATGFVLDQSDVIAQHGIEAAVEVPFGAFKTYQVEVSEIEELTGLKFSYVEGGKTLSLSTVDPMAQPGSRSRVRRARIRTQESFGGSSAPEGYVLLDSPTAIIRPIED